MESSGVETQGMTRSSALKLGALSLVGAAFGGLLPGRARAGNLYPAPCKPGQGFVCGNGHGVTGCGGPGSGCGCVTQYLGRKLEGTKSFCVDTNVCCDSLQVCTNGQSDCPPGYTCSNTTCCGEPVCLAPCGTSAPPAVCCLTPIGQTTNNCNTCATGGNCNVGFTQCGCIGVDGSFCFTTTENTAFCGVNDFCENLSSCTSSSQCPTGYLCGASNGCTGCDSGSGVCIQLCSAAAPSKKSPRGSGMTVTGVRY